MTQQVIEKVAESNQKAFCYFVAYFLKISNLLSKFRFDDAEWTTIVWRETFA
jgi:hypothetical protein